MHQPKCRQEVEKVGSKTATLTLWKLHSRRLSTFLSVFAGKNTIPHTTTLLHYLPFSLSFSFWFILVTVNLFGLLVDGFQLLACFSYPVLMLRADLVLRETFINFLLTNI